MITSFHNKNPRGYPRGRCLCVLLRAVSNETYVLNTQIGLRALLAPLGCVPCIFRPRWTLPPAALSIICLLTFTRGRGGAYAFTLSQFHFPPLGGLLRVCRNNFTISAARSLVHVSRRSPAPCVGLCLVLVYVSRRSPAPLSLRRLFVVAGCLSAGLSRRPRSCFRALPRSVLPLPFPIGFRFGRGRERLPLALRRWLFVLTSAIFRNTSKCQISRSAARRRGGVAFRC